MNLIQISVLCTNKPVDQLTLDCSNLTKILSLRFRNAVALNIYWEKFTALMVLPGLNLN